MTNAKTLDHGQIRSVILEVIEGLKQQQYSHLQSGAVLQRAIDLLGRSGGLPTEQMLLACFYDLFRTGYLSWGHDIANPSPPFFHVTALGRGALAARGRDPANPDGYLSHLQRQAALSQVAEPYIREALNTFN